jgi:hypothetical protein
LLCVDGHVVQLQRVCLKRIKQQEKRSATVKPKYAWGIYAAWGRAWV